MMEESAHMQLTVPDILMPVQYYDGMRRGNLETHAIKRLMFAVLADAVRRFQTYADARSRAGRRMFGLHALSDGQRTVCICHLRAILCCLLGDGLCAFGYFSL